MTNLWQNACVLLLAMRPCRVAQRLTLIRPMARVISRGAAPALLRRWELRTGRVPSVSQPLQKAGFPDITHNLRKKGKEPTQTPLSLYQHGHPCEQVGMG